MQRFEGFQDATVKRLQTFIKLEAAAARQQGARMAKRHAHTLEFTHPHLAGHTPRPALAMCPAF